MITKSDYLAYLENLLERMRRDSSVIDLAYTEDELPLPDGVPSTDGRHRRLTVHWVETDKIQDENIQFEVIEKMLDTCNNKIDSILAQIKIMEEHP